MKKYEADYRQLHGEGKFPGTTILKYKEQIREILNEAKVEDALDYGCGKALAYTQHNLQEYFGIPMDLYEPFAGTQFNQLKGCAYDAVLCIDVVEQIPGEEIEETLAEIFSLAKKVVVLTFCQRDAKKVLPIAKVNAHVLQRSDKWWHETIARINTNKIKYFLFETN